MATMKAIRMHDYGGPDTLRYEDTPQPSPGAGEVLVRVAAAGVNPIDWKVRAGFMKQHVPLALPWTPGLDFSGVVESVGSGVKAFAAGDAVFGKTDLPRDGSYAQYLALPITGVVRKPAAIDDVHAAALPLAALTAWQGLFGQGALELGKGQTVLVLGAAGGVGSFAVQLAKWKGARVIAAARPGQEAVLGELGVDVVIDTTKSDLSAAGPVDAVLDLVGGELQQRAWAQVKRGGAFASTLGAPSAQQAESHAARTHAIFTQTNVQQLAEIADLLAKGKLRVQVAKTLPFAQAGQAHALLESHGVSGKLVLTMG